MGSIFLIAYVLITACCEGPQTIMALALYEINYYNYIIIKLIFFEDHTDDNNYYFYITYIIN